MRIVFILLFALPLQAQNIVGDWYGQLDVLGTKLRIVFHIAQSEKGYSSTMDSPDQKAFGIPSTSTAFADPNLSITLQSAGLTYDAVLKNGVLEGTFKQGGGAFPLVMTGKAIEREAAKRPQEPKPPFPYYTEEVTFVNDKADGVTLAGTLTLPSKEGKHPVVVLVSGSGPQDRNEEILEHKPFLVLADHLTRNGFGVLRYDDRGVGKSTGAFGMATTKDLAHDAAAAVRFLTNRKEIDTRKIGMIGHSEGGLIAPIVAGELAPESVAFIVLMAGTGISGDELLLLQQALIARAEGAPEKQIEQTKKVNQGAFEILRKTPEKDQKQALIAYMTKAIKETPAAEKTNGLSDENAVKIAVEELLSPWMRYFLTYDPAPALKKVKCPVLVLNGDKDLQVPAEINTKAIQKSLKKAKNKKVVVSVLPNHNHLFQTSETGKTSEYGNIEETLSPLTLKTITEWLFKQ